MQADGKILAGGLFNGTNSIGGRTRNRIARGSLTGLLIRSTRTQLPCLFYCRAGGRPSLGRRRFTTMGGQTAPHCAIEHGAGRSTWHSTRTRAVCLCHRGAGGRQDSGGRDFNGANSIGGQTRNFIARLDPAQGWLIPSIRTQTSSSHIAVQADGKSGGGLFQRSEQHRWPDPQPHRAARSHDRPGRFLRPQCKQYCPCHRGAGGRKNPGWRLFQWDEQHRRTGAQFYRPARWYHRPGRSVQSEPNRYSVLSIAIQADGKTLAGGDFTLTPNGVATTVRNNIARLETDGRLDQTLVDLNIHRKI